MMDGHIQEERERRESVMNRLQDSRSEMQGIIRTQTDFQRRVQDELDQKESVCSKYEVTYTDTTSLIIH
jgi:hypothetical protein